MTVATPSSEMRIDCHAHVFDLRRYPYSNEPGYKPLPNEAGTVDEFLAVLDAHGFTHGVLVNSTTSYGTDNRCLMDALARGGGRLKGMAVVDAEVTDAELDRLAQGGVAGIRLNLMHHGLKPVTDAAELRLLEKLRERDWIIEIYTSADKLAVALPVLQRMKLRILVDHCGKPDPSLALEQPGFRELLEFGRNGGGWIKLSGPFRFSRTPWPYADADSYVAALVEAFTPERAIWGSDWPFIQRSERTDYGPTLACLDRWLSDPAARRKVLLETPMRLFEFA